MLGTPCDQGLPTPLLTCLPHVFTEPCIAMPSRASHGLVLLSLNNARLVCPHSRVCPRRRFLPDRRAQAPGSCRHAWRVHHAPPPLASQGQPLGAPRGSRLLPPTLRASGCCPVARSCCHPVQPPDIEAVRLCRQPLADASRCWRRARQATATPPGLLRPTAKSRSGARPWRSAASSCRSCWPCCWGSQGSRCVPRCAVLLLMGVALEAVGHLHTALHALVLVPLPLSAFGSAAPPVARCASRGIPPPRPRARNSHPPP